MLTVKTTSVATAIAFFLTSYAPSQAFQMPQLNSNRILQTQDMGVIEIQNRPPPGPPGNNMRPPPPPPGNNMRPPPPPPGNNMRPPPPPPPPKQGFYNGHQGVTQQRPGYRYHNGYWYPLAAFAVGAIIGGALNKPKAEPQPVFSGMHYQWCQDRWRSYRASDNTYQPNVGPRKQCVSPYAR